MTPPSSRPPPGVPTSGGNVRYLVLAGLLLVAVVAVVFWRTASERASAPAPTPSTPIVALAPTATNPKMDDIPPPPPIEEKPEGGSGPRVIYVQQGGCEGKCVGTAPPELNQALQVRGAQARRCYNEALAKDPSLRGHVAINVRIGTAGNVCSVNVTNNDMGSANVANCAAHILGSAGYPAPRGGCVEGVVPLSFVPQGQ
jgi:hypothetical protein